MKGSITVEAVFLIPILLFVILAFMYMGLYFYDQIYIETAAQNLALEEEQRIRYTVDETGKIKYNQESVKGLEKLLNNTSYEENFVDQKLKEIMNKSLFLGELKTTSIEIKTEKIKIQVVSVISSLTKAIGVYLPKTNRVSKHVIKMTVHNPEEFVRGYTAVAEIVEESNGGGKIKATLQKLLKYIGR